MRQLRPDAGVRGWVCAAGAAQTRAIALLGLHAALSLQFLLLVLARLASALREPAYRQLRTRECSDGKVSPEIEPQPDLSATENLLDSLFPFRFARSYLGVHVESDRFSQRSSAVCLIGFQIGSR